MKVVLVHNFYQIAGGEDSVFKNEAEMLIRDGHEVVLYTKDNHAIKTTWQRMLVFFACIFSIREFLQFWRFISLKKPDIVHVHNYFPLISPAVFYCCYLRKVPVVHTLHNFRAICPTAILAHQGKIEERSVRGSAFWAVKSRVYKNSLLGSFSLYLMVSIHKKLGTWQRCVDKFICLTEFSKGKFTEAGWPIHKLSVKPNFLRSSAADIHPSKSGALYVGRLSEEKGIQVLLDAWKNINYPLTIVGDGPLKNLVVTHDNPNITYVGFKSSAEVLELLQTAAFIVMPSTCYEGLPMVLIEAFSVGTPAIVSNIGGMKEVVQNEISGMHFKVADSEDLSKQVNKLIVNAKLLSDLSEGAKQNYLKHYAEEANCRVLVKIYESAIMECKRRTYA